MALAPRLIRIVWLDSRGTAGWSSDPLYENPPMTSVGYEVGERNGSLYFAGTFDPDGSQYADVSCIPLGCVIAKIELVDRPPD